MKQVTLEIRYTTLAAFLEAMTDNTEQDRPLYLDLINVHTNSPSFMRVLVLSAFTEETGDGGLIMHRFIVNCGIVLASMAKDEEAMKKAEKIVEVLGTAIGNYGWKRKSAIMLLPGENARDW